MAEIFHSFNMRSQRKSIFSLKGVNLLLLASAALSLLLTAAVCEIPALAAAFSFTSLSLEQFGIALAIGFAVIPVVEIVKLFQRMAAKR
jgi:Ca2+-transporting ATPase